MRCNSYHVYTENHWKNKLCIWIVILWAEKQKFHFKNKRGAFAYSVPSLACSAIRWQLKQTRTQLEIFRNRGQQPAGHARPLTCYHLIYCQILQTEPANGYLEIHVKHKESIWLYGYTSGKLNFISFFHICQPFNKAKRQIYRIRTINFPKVGKQRFMCQLSHHIKKKYVVRLNVSQYKMGWFRTSPQRLHPAKFCWGQTFPNILILLAGIKNINRSTGSKWTL